MLTLAARTPQKPRNRIEGYFDEAPDDRKQRLAAERDDDFRSRNEQAQQLFESGQLDELFDATMPLVHSRARKLQWAFEFDDFTLDDIVQVGRVGLWRAINSYDGKITFRTYALLCIKRAMWKEFGRLKAQKRRGFKKLAHEHRLPESNTDCCERLAETEAIGVVMEMLGWLPEDWQKIAMFRANGERLCVIADHLGCSQAHVCRVYKRVIAHLEEVALPQMLGAWTPFPCVMGDVWESFESASPGEMPPLSELAECEHCGEMFRVAHGNHRFCNTDCARAAKPARRVA